MTDLGEDSEALDVRASAAGPRLPVTGYRARAAVRVELDDDGVPRLTTLRSDGPLVLRGRVSHGIAVVRMVGAAAVPSGGDALRLDLFVGPGASLDFGTVAASLVHPSPTGIASAFEVTATVRGGAALTYRPEPTVAIAGCRHRAEATVDVARDASLIWRDELVLGRHNERSGRLASRLDVTVDGRPLLRQELSVGDPETDRSGAVLGGSRTVGSVLIAGDVKASPAHGPGFAIQPLTGPGVLITAVAPDAVVLRERLEAAERLATNR